jgi:hypothetical protein
MHVVDTLLRIQSWGYAVQVQGPDDHLEFIAVSPGVFGIAHRMRSQGEGIEATFKAVQELEKQIRLAAQRCAWSTHFLDKLQHRVGERRRYPDRRRRR